MHKRISVLLFLYLIINIACAQKRSLHSEYNSYAGKYEMNGFVVQVAIYHDTVTLVIPGAPLQKLISVGNHRFKSEDYNDSYFTFIPDGKRITKMISQGNNNTVELIKVSDKPDRVNKGDSLLSLKKSTPHFLFLFSEIDIPSVDTIARRLESSYQKIVSDFNIKGLPVITVRIYPTAKSFHDGINFPDAPPNILATAFGKKDVRMISPHAVTPEEGEMLLHHITHEFVHCVHLNIEYAPNNPRWLWEGIAMYESGWFMNPAEMDIIRNKTFPPLMSLNNGAEYELGYAILEAIHDLWGFNTIIDLIKKKGDTNACLQLSQEEFDRKVYDQIYRKYVHN